MKRSSEENPRISRIISACKRCRLRKIKCDRALPKCGNCVKAGVDECLCLVASSGEAINRLYIQDLEQKVADLEKQVDLHKAREAAHTMQFGRTFLLPETGVSSMEEELPSLEFVETCLEGYFHVCNAQLPILHREVFLATYFEPLYGRVSQDLYSRITGCDVEELPSGSGCSDRRRCLFFVHAVLAISTSLHQQKFPLKVSAHHQAQALRYVDSVWDAADDGGRLEMLQLLLLLAQYSMMRPSSPGAWYVVGTACRLCLDLGLQHAVTTPDSYTTEMRRRLFWCTYCLDRQVLIYFHQSFSIDEHYVTTPLPLLLDDSQILPPHLHLSPAAGGKQVAIKFIRLRQLQLQIHDFINNKHHRIMVDRDAHGDNVEIVRRVAQYDAWKQERYAELVAWMQDADAPSGAAASKAHHFLSSVMTLNFLQTLIQIFGVSAITPMIVHPEHFVLLHDAGRDIITTYACLQADVHLLNYLWIAINNVTLGALCYFFTLIHNRATRQTTCVDDVSQYYGCVTGFLEEMAATCHDQATTARAKVEALYHTAVAAFQNDNYSLPFTFPTPKDIFPFDLPFTPISDTQR